MADRKKVTTPIFRVSFPSVFEAKSMNGGKAKYGLSMLFTPTTFTDNDKKRWAEMIALADEASLEKFKKKVKDLPDNFKKPFRKGEEKEGMEGYGPGVIFCNATSQQKPGLVDANRNLITSEEDFYPGCYARATVVAYAYDNQGKGVAFGLNNIQKVKDGETFSSRTPADEDFEDDLGDQAGKKPETADPFA